MNDLEQYLNKNSCIVFRKVEKNILLIRIQQNVGTPTCIYSLNETGAFIWELIDGKRKLIEIINIVVKKYGIDQEEAEADVLIFIEELQKIDGICSEFTGKPTSNFTIDIENIGYEKPTLINYSFNDESTTPEINVAWTLNGVGSC